MAVRLWRDAAGICSNKKRARSARECMRWVQRQIHEDPGADEIEINEAGNQTGFCLDRLDDVLHRMDGHAESYRYVYLLRQCSNHRALPEAKRVHEQISRNGFDCETFLGNLLVETYRECGSLEDARLAFEKIERWNVFSFTLMISAYDRNSDGLSAIELFKRMNLEGLKPDRVTLLSLIASCSSLGALAEGKAIHACVAESGLEPEVGNALVNMYTKCGSLTEARKLFERVQRKDLFSWTAMIGACCQHGYNRDALEFYHKLDLEGVKPDIVTFINALRASTNLEALAEGAVIHQRVVADGLDSDVIVGNALVHMYSKCGQLADARHVFGQMSYKNVTSWNTMIAAYAREGLARDSILLYQGMMLEGVKPNDVTFIGILGACTQEYAKEIHACVVASGLETQLIVGTALVNMYGKSGKLDEARKVFRKLGSRNVVTWNSVIGAYAQYGHAIEALKLHQKMDLEGVKPNSVSFLSLLDACSDLESLVDGEAIHARIVVTGFTSNVVLDTALVNMYCKCKSLEQARRVFDQMLITSAVTWTTIIAAYAQQGRGLEALQLYRKMDLEGLKPDEITFVNVLGACSTLGVRSQAEAIHARIVASGLKSDVVGNNLVNMYSRLGDLADAQQVFDEMDRDVFSCTAMIAAYAQHGYGKEALELYQKMDLEGLKPDDITYVSVLDACTRMEALKSGRLIHERIVASGSDSDVYVMTALINMYGKCGDLENARAVFDKMLMRNVVSWNAMIASYAQHGHNKEAVELYQKMDPDGVEADELTYVAAIGACSNLGSLVEGRPIHARVIGAGLESGPVVSTALINMYGKCGSLEEARKVFDKSCWWNVVSWNTMIGAYAHNGHGKEGLELYELMNLEGVEPNEVTYIGILFACSHAGLLEEGWRQFLSLSRDRGITWTDEHYGCMIDLLGRVGRLDEAEDLINSIPQPGGVAWMSLLGACQLHGDLDRGARVSERVIDLNPEKSSSYILLSNIYAAARRWKDVARVRKMMEDKGIKKQAGHSIIEGKNWMHKFNSGYVVAPRQKEARAS